MEIGKEDFIDGVEMGGVATFIADASGVQVLAVYLTITKATGKRKGKS